jgi:hypothetical protein
MLTTLLCLLHLAGADTLRVYNSHDHEMTVSAVIGTRTVELGVVQPGDTAAFAVDIPAGVTQLELRAYPPDNPLGQITFILALKPGKRLFWTFEDS